MVVEVPSGTNLDSHHIVLSPIVEKKPCTSISWQSLIYIFLNTLYTHQVRMQAPLKMILDIEKKEILAASHRSPLIQQAAE